MPGRWGPGEGGGLTVVGVGLFGLGMAWHSLSGTGGAAGRNYLADRDFVSLNAKYGF